MFLIFVFLTTFTSLCFGQTQNVSIPENGNAEEREIIQLLDDHFDGNFHVFELPIQRSIHYVTQGKLDFHYPVLLPLSNVKKTFDYAFSSITVSTVVYAVYVNKMNKKIAVHNLQDYLIEGESGHVDFFDFKVMPSTCVECSFKKVDTARIDGYIYPALAGDKIIKNLKLNNIESYYFDTYEIKFALPLSQKGINGNKLLTELFDKAKKSKRYKDVYLEAFKLNKSWKPIRN